MATPLDNAGRVSEGASVATRVTNTAKYTVKKGVSALGHFGGAWLGVSTAATALISQWEHTSEKKRITDEYRPEIATMLGKRADKVTVGDMEKAAKENSTIKEALERSTKRRNLSVGVTIAGAVLALAVVAPLAGIAVGAALPALAVGGIAHSLAVGGVTALGFLGLEKGLEKFGEKKLHLEEPSLKIVMKHQEKQAELSVPSQVTFLAQKQAKGQAVSQEQVMTVFTSASPGLSRQIEASYGKKFEELGNAQKRDAIETYGAQYHIAALTADINEHHIRAQELGFIVNGQSSGVAPTGSSRVAAVERKAAALSQPPAVDAPVTNREASGQRLAFARSKVSAATARQRQEETAWRRRIEAERQQREASMGVA